MKWEIKFKLNDKNAPDTIEHKIEIGIMVVAKNEEAAIHKATEVLSKRFKKTTINLEFSSAKEVASPKNGFQTGIINKKDGKEQVKQK